MGLGKGCQTIMSALAPSPVAPRWAFRECSSEQVAQILHGFPEHFRTFPQFVSCHKPSVYPILLLATLCSCWTCPLLSHICCWVLWWFFSLHPADPPILNSALMAAPSEASSLESSSNGRAFLHPTSSSLWGPLGPSSCWDSSVPSCNAQSGLGPSPFLSLMLLGDFLCLL